ncbi:MAG: MarR family transcriptional regulator [Oscillospiraceae bacterium]|nr:MarR family transcriptional regulator [Oscillospiraceae bacterium]
MPYSSKALKRFNHLLSETGAAYHEAAVRLGLPDSVMRILYTICGYDSGFRCPLREVCVRTGISKQTINSALRRLEAEGIVYLERADAKHKDICLTEQGIRLAERTAVRVMEAEDAVLAAWPRKDVETYLALTEKYLTAFRKETETLHLEQELRDP